MCRWRKTAPIDAGFDIALTPNAIADVSYSGQFGDHAQDNAIKGDVTGCSDLDPRTVRASNGRMPARIDIVEGDITTLPVDAIVNAANEALALGGGVCGAIHRAAGPELANACAALGGCATGDAKITPGFNLQARYVIHAVGPVWGGGERGEGKLLAGCYRNSLRLAAEHGLTTIAFPAISTGIYGFPADRAAFIAARTVRETLPEVPGITRVVFSCFGRDSYELHEAALAATAPQD